LEKQTGESVGLKIRGSGANSDYWEELIAWRIRVQKDVRITVTESSDQRK